MERALARYLPQTDIFHFYFGQTLVEDVPVPDRGDPEEVRHALPRRRRHPQQDPDELAYGKRADKQIVGSYAATRWVPEAVVVRPASTSPSTPVHPSSASGPSSSAPPTSKKGTRFVIEACEQLPVDWNVVHGVPHEEAVERFKRADIVVDQMHYIWHGVFAIESMACRSRW